MAPPARSSAAAQFESLSTGGKVGLLLLLLGLLGAAFYSVLYMPLSDEIDSARAKYRKLQQEHREAKQRQQRFVAITQELAQREPIDRRNKRALPEEAEMAAFLEDINRLAELSGLDIRLIEPRPEEAEPLYVKIPVALQLTGRYHQFMKFFYNVSRLERAINMEDVRVGRPRKEGDETLLDVDVLATTFRRPSAAQPPAAGAPGAAGPRGASGRPGAMRPSGGRR